MESLFQDLFFHIFVLKLNESVALFPSKATILPALSTASISLQYYFKLPDVFE